MLPVNQQSPFQKWVSLMQNNNTSVRKNPRRCPPPAHTRFYRPLYFQISIMCLRSYGRQLCVLLTGQTMDGREPTIPTREAGRAEDRYYHSQEWFI